MSDANLGRNICLDYFHECDEIHELGRNKSFQIQEFSLQILKFGASERSLSQELSQCYHLDTILLKSWFVSVWQPAEFTWKKDSVVFQVILKK